MNKLYPSGIFEPLPAVARHVDVFVQLTEQGTGVQVSKDAMGPNYTQVGS